MSGAQLRRWPETFTRLGSRRVGGGSKTWEGQAVSWRGELAGRLLDVETRPRTILGSLSTFMVPANARINYERRVAGDPGDFLDVAVTRCRGRQLDEGMRELLAELIEAEREGWPEGTEFARVRFPGERVR